MLQLIKDEDTHTHSQLKYRLAVCLIAPLNETVSIINVSTASMQKKIDAAKKHLHRFTSRTCCCSNESLDRDTTGISLLGGGYRLEAHSITLT